MGLSRFELESHGPEPYRIDQATPQTRWRLFLLELREYQAQDIKDFLDIVVSV